MIPAKAHAIGDLVAVGEGAVVRTPDGDEHKVSGGAYVLDAYGTFVVNGEEITVPAPEPAVVQAPEDEDPT